MKHIQKGTSPDFFEKWKTSGNEDWQPSFRDLRPPEKTELHSALLDEQGWVCCYCGRRIGIDESHIEHFWPQTPYSSLALDYRNLYVSCIREQKLGMPLHCGHKKGNQFQESKYIDLTDPQCEARFLYTAQGNILTTNESDDRANYMRELLALDTPFLNAAREAVINGALDPEFLIDATADDLRKLQAAYRESTDGMLMDFGHVLAAYAEQRLNDVAGQDDAT